MPDFASQVTAPARPLVEGPSAWIGSDMRNREAEWSYRLSSSEIAEIEAAVRQVRARGLDIAEIRREDFPLPTLGTGARPHMRRGARRARLCAAARPAGRGPADRRQRDRLLGHRHLFRQRPIAKCQGASARACLRSGPGPERDQPPFAQLRHRGTPEFPYRPLRRRRAVVPAAREVGRPVDDRQLDGGAQRHGGAPTRPAGALVPAVPGGPARRGARRARRRSTKHRCSTPMPTRFRCCTRASISAQRSAFPRRGG